MNRLILIGNGFDLAHSMNTSYRHFIVDYLRDSYKNARNNQAFEDKLIKIRKNHRAQEQPNSGILMDFWDIENFTKYIDAPTYYERDPFNRNILMFTYDYIFESKSALIKILLTKCDEYNWVDVENEYYLMLCELSSKEDQAEILQLNQEFEYLQSMLQDYLRKIEKTYVDEQSQKYLKSTLVSQLTESINTTQVQMALLGNNHPNLKPENILVLNFNYTITIEDYLNDIKKECPNTYVINIHGKIDDPENPIIFGYGDEEETNYTTLEKYDECLRFVKTYRYSRTHNYQKFIDFIIGEKYEVYVLGHSCGLSDKTLLSEIFNNENCFKIKLLTYNKKQDETLTIDSTDYIEKTYQIGRVFKQKSEMRRKLIPYSPNDLIQIRKVN